MLEPLRLCPDDRPSLGVMQAPGPQARYFLDVLPLVAEVRVGTSWAEAH